MILQEVILKYQEIIYFDLEIDDWTYPHLNEMGLF